MKTRVAISEALADKSLLGASLGDLTSWAVWVAVLRAAFGLSLDADQLAAFKSVAGHREPPSERVRELWAVAGRRSGKSRVAAALAVYLATMTDARSQLAPGEQGFVLVLAPSIAQADVILRYCIGFIQSSPLLRAQLEGEPTRTEIRLRGNVVIAVHPASYRTVRGRTLLAAIFDETAFWRDELSANPDLEVYRAALPALATTNGLLVGIGSPYGKRGLLWRKHREHYGQDGDDVLVAKGPSSAFNPTLDHALIEAAERDDPEAAQSEWQGEFRSNIASLFDDTVIDGAIDYGRPLEMPPRPGVKYFAFCDASAGRHDAFALCIGHADGDRFVADVVRGRAAPFDPGETAAEFAALAKSYGVRRVVGDNFSGEWVASAFRDSGVTYAVSDMPKSALYLEALPWFNRRAVRLPEHQHLIRELRLLERRVHRSGKDSVDHPARGSDDLANVVCGCLRLAVKAQRGEIAVGVSFPGGGRVYPVEPKRERQLRIVACGEADLELTPSGLWRFREDQLCQ